MPLSPEDKRSIAYDKFNGTAYFLMRALPVVCALALGALVVEGVATRGFSDLSPETQRWLFGNYIAVVCGVPVASAIFLLIGQYYWERVKVDQAEDRKRRGLTH